MGRTADNPLQQKSTFTRQPDPSHPSATHSHSADQAKGQGFTKLIIEAKLMDKGMKPLTKTISLE
jgi:hypothetical protein